MLWLARGRGGEGPTFLYTTPYWPLYVHHYSYTHINTHNLRYPLRDSLFFYCYLLLVAHIHLHTLSRTQCIKTARCKSWICISTYSMQTTHIAMLPLTVNNRNPCIHTGSKQHWRVTKIRITKKENNSGGPLYTKHSADNWARKHLLSRDKQNNKQPTNSRVGGLRKHTKYLTRCPRNTVGSLTRFLAEHINISSQSSFTI